MLQNLLKAAATALAMLTITPAVHANDYKSRRSYMQPAPQRGWTGFYGGLNVGYGLAGVSDTTPLGVTSLMSGVIGGGQIGYNYQLSSWVVGVEADIQTSGMNQSYGYTLPVVGALSVGNKISYFGTLRGRLGYTFDCGCVMAYGTAGIGYGAYEAYATALGITSSKSYTNAAAVVGAGVEWKMAQQWSAKLEGLYFDTGNVATGITLPVLGAIETRTRATMLRLGVNYHF